MLAPARRARRRQSTAAVYARFDERGGRPRLRRACAAARRRSQRCAAARPRRAAAERSRQLAARGRAPRSARSVPTSAEPGRSTASSATAPAAEAAAAAPAGGGAGPRPGSRRPCGERNGRATLSRRLYRSVHVRYVIEHRESRFARPAAPAGGCRWRSLLAAVEAILVLAGVIPWWRVLAAAATAVAGSLAWPRPPVADPCAPRPGWRAVSQLIVILVPVAVVVSRAARDPDRRPARGVGPGCPSCSTGAEPAQDGTPPGRLLLPIHWGVAKR